MAEVRTGIQTDEEIEGDPYGFRVTWIEWDSRFRSTDLAIGDLILALDGVPYTLEGRQETAPRAIGQYHEGLFWEDNGAADGDEVTLTVLRGNDELEIRGALHSEVFYQDGKERRALGPGGPPRLGTSSEDGSFSSWSGWYETFVKRCSYVLDAGWNCLVAVS